MKQKQKLKDSRQSLLENLLEINLTEQKILQDIKFIGIDKRELAKKQKQLTHEFNKLQEKKNPLMDRLQ
jgi:hypothetical protein